MWESGNLAPYGELFLTNKKFKLNPIGIVVFGGNLVYRNKKLSKFIQLTGHLQSRRMLPSVLKREASIGLRSLE